MKDCSTPGFEPATPARVASNARGESPIVRASSRFLQPFFLLTCFTLGLCFLQSPLRAVSPFDGAATKPATCKIDELVFKQLKEQNLQPAQLCSDAVFLRRIYLDLIGAIPSAKEAREFYADKDPQKRSKLIERLLQHSEYADYWMMKWSDLLRVKSEFPINLWPNAVQAYSRWIQESLKENKRYDVMAREMLKASGSNFRVGPVNFYRAMQGSDAQTIAKTAALTFLGSRTEAWPKERFLQFSAFFAQIGFKGTAEWKEQIVFFDPSASAAAAKSGIPAITVFPDGSPVLVTPDQDPREVFADWLTKPSNPYFAKVMANRAWYWLMGRGIVHEPDDFRDNNPPSNPALLGYLEQEFVKSDFDLKQLFRLITNSQVYQLSPIPPKDSKADPSAFASYPLRRLEAEVLIDALNLITGTTEKYSSPIPEPFTYIPEDQRSVALSDGSITSSFLELFGRSSRDTGMENERNNKPSATQSMHMLNSSHIQRKIEQSSLIRSLLFTKNTPRSSVNEIYLSVLSRFPTEEEFQTASAYSQKNNLKNRESAIDLIWALINSPEFMYRH